MTQDARPRIEDLQARLGQVIEDLRAGRISPAEATKVTNEIRAELRIVEAAMRMAKVARRLGGA